MPPPPSRLRYPPAADAPRRARADLLRGMLAAGVDTDSELADVVLLLASELCENAVLHAGTAFDVALQARPEAVTVAVSDHGAGPLEVHLAQPRQQFGRASTHGRGLLLIERLATSWGTRHDADGTHTVWFTVRRADVPPPAAEPGPAVAAAAAVATAEEPAVAPTVAWPDADRVRRLLHVTGTLGERLEPDVVVAELARRLREIADVDGVLVEVDHGDGAGVRRLAHDGGDPAELPADRVRDVRLPVTAPLRGRLRIAHRPGAAPSPELAELAAQRIALAVESGWLRGADRRRRAWLAYLADTSQLLGQSLDVGLTVTVVPQVVVPRLGHWCAVHLSDAVGVLTLAALTHADEDRIPELRTALDPAPGAAMPAEVRARLREVARGGATAWISWPSDGVAVPLTAAGRTVGVLSVGRPPDRTHTPEDVALVTDIARRSALAIDNAQRIARHVATSQALQQALLPRALPSADDVEFAAAYLPASTGTDVGGDFYDVLTLRSGHWLAAIGDVCGKGARAAARTGLVRDVLRVLVRDGRSLPHALELLNDVMMDAADPTQFCTLAAARLWRDHAGLVVDLALGGHPRPVLVRADGGAELVGEFGTALGLLSRVEIPCTRHRLRPGDALLAYTDGVTESRGPGGLYGPERLVAAAAAAGAASAAGLVAAVRASVEGHSRDDRRDDIALLVIRAGGNGH